MPHWIEKPMRGSNVKRDPNHDPYEDVTPEVAEIIHAIEPIAAGRITFARAAAMAEAVVALVDPADVATLTAAIRAADGIRMGVSRYEELARLIHQHQTNTQPAPSTNEVLAGAKPPSGHVLPRQVDPLTLEDGRKAE